MVSLMRAHRSSNGSGPPRSWGLSSSSASACWGCGPGCKDAQTYWGSWGRSWLPSLGFLGVLGTLGGSVLLGIAALRAKVLPRWARVVLTLAPLAFIPAIIATIPLESVAPDYVIADLPFPVVGLVLATVGYAVLDSRGDAEEKMKNRPLVADTESL